MLGVPSGLVEIMLILIGGCPDFLWLSCLLVLYNVLLPINCYTSNIITKCHNESMSDNRDLTETFHQKGSSLPVSIASDSRYFQTS